MRAGIFCGIVVMWAGIAAAQPNFDECSGALAVPPATGGPFVVDLNGMTDGVGDPVRSCTGEPGHQNIWLSVTPEVDGIFYVSAGGSVSVYAGTCGGLNEMVCGSPNSITSAALLAGQTYLVELSGPPFGYPLRAWYCGDGFQTDGEACDDGNLIDTDGCNNRCEPPAPPGCGNGTVEGAEQCDDGNLIDTDACTAQCRHAVCGDGSLHEGVEACDDGNTLDDDGCSAICFDEGSCGDGIEQAPEECDDGNLSNTDACTTACHDAVCGDGFVRTGVEQCDDGNLVDDDGCQSTCQLPTNDDCTNPTIISSLPFNDSANLNGATTSPSDPVRSCTSQQGPHNRWFQYTVPIGVNGSLRIQTFAQVSVYTGACGALVEAACNAGPAPTSVAVSSGQTYRLELSIDTGAIVPLMISLCGNGVFEPGEQCDDGNTDDTDACSNACVAASCGDGITQSGEQCDDGNATPGDGCENDCFVTSVCGNGTVEGHESCDDGNTDDGDGCDGDCRLPCPDDLCKCLGAAAQFATVGTKYAVKNGKFAEGGESEVIPTEVEGSMCGVTGKYTAKLDGASSIVGDVVMTATAKVAVQFKGARFEGDPEPGAYVDGDVATGGGLVKGDLDYLELGGVIDTSNTHPLVAECRQAALDVASASTTLAALTPTQTLGAISVGPDEERIIAVGPGRQVVKIDSITLRGFTAESDGGFLEFELQPTTDVLIVNVSGNVSLGNGSVLTATLPGAGQAVLNLHGASSKLKIGKEASLELPVIAPVTKLTVPGDAFSDALFTNDDIALKGGGVYSTLDCEE